MRRRTFFDTIRRAAWAGALLVPVLGWTACESPVAPTDELRAGQPVFDQVTDAVITRMRGAGTLGGGEPAGDSIWLQEFELDVSLESGIVQGYFDYVDHSVFKSDGKAAHLRVAPDAEGSVIADYVQISATCVEFEGIGKLLNTGELLHFKVRACDNGHPGVGLDMFAIWVPQRLVTDATLYQRGPDMLSEGEFTATKLQASTVTITRMTGEGALGDGAPAGDGIWLQTLAVDVGVEGDAVVGQLDYVDHSVVKDDGESAHLVVSSTEPGTAITTFTQVSETCVEFSGVGRIVNDGEMVNFWARACDNGSPGVDMDLFEIRVPDHLYERRDLLSEGDLVRSVLLG